MQAQALAPAGISLTKTASRSRVTKVGQVVTYTFVARNTGGVALDDVAITDELDGLDSGCPASTTLAPGAVLRCTATLTVTQDWMDFGSIDNSATVFGSYEVAEAPDDYVGANASAHVSVDQKPAISLKASVSPTGTVDAGDRLRYAATATNTGNVTSGEPGSPAAWSPSTSTASRRPERPWPRASRSAATGPTRSPRATADAGG